jgi:hypothetical protein
MAASANKDDVCSKITIRVPTKEDWELYDRVGDDIWEGEAISQVCNHEMEGEKKEPGFFDLQRFSSALPCTLAGLTRAEAFFLPHFPVEHCWWPVLTVSHLRRTQQHLNK